MRPWVYCLLPKTTNKNEIKQKPLLLSYSNKDSVVLVKE
jgi:hypothetical protein